LEVVKIRLREQQEETFMRKGWIATAGIALAVVLFLGGCSGQPLSDREMGTGGGALLGAGTGAIIGAAVGHPAAGALIGGGLGGVGGYAVGNAMQNQQVQNDQTQSQIQAQQQQLEQQRREIESMRSQQNTE
jgi:uncharacterized protein YcfJ